MSGIMGIGLRSLSAFQSAIETTAQNIGNAETPFYSRRVVDFVSQMFNNGVSIGDVRRIYDDIANVNLLNSESNLGSINNLLNSISDLEKVFDNDANNVNKYINDSINSLQDLTANVKSVQARTAYLTQLSNIADRINVLGSSIIQNEVNTNKNITNTVGYANDLLKQISLINGQISQSGSNDQLTLLDQRNALTHDLAKYMNFSTYTDDKNVLTISLTNGLNVVSPTGYSQLSVRQDPSDFTKIKIYMTQGTNVSDVTQYISSGEIGGMLKYRNEVLDMAEAGLGRLALAISAVFNSQNKLGADMYGNLGKDVFADNNTTGMQAGRVFNNAQNTGAGVINVCISNISQITTSNYVLNFSDATHYSVTRLSDSTVMTSGNITSYPASISVDGMSINITSGSFSAGDNFLIKPTYNAMENISLLITDPKRLALAFPVTAQATTTNVGTGVITVDSILSTTNSSFSNAASKQLNPPIQIQFLTATTYQLLDISNPSSPVVMQGPITYNPAIKNDIFPTPAPTNYDPGYRVSLSGTITAGDTFTINYNSNGNGNSNALAFSSLYTNSFIENGSMTMNQAYQITSNNISLITNSATTEYNSAKAVYDQADKRYDNISGVSQQEEMINLSEYQQSYQASAQIIQAAKTIFETIIMMLR